jgi:hypothetical protein
MLPGLTLDWHTAAPERRLMSAVLEDALSILLAPRPLGRRDRAQRAETERWLLANDFTWPFSFVNVCRALDVDPASLRHDVASRLEHRERLQPAA